MRRAFSLFEIILAIALMMMLGGAVFGFFFELLDQRRRVEAASEVQQAASVVVERLESDVQSLIAGSAALGAGISGTNDRIKILSRAVTAPLQDGVIAMGDLQGSELVFDVESGELRAGRWDALGERGGRGLDLVSDRFERVRFRYHDGRRWRPTFDSAASGGLPVAIELAIWFRSGDDRVIEANDFSLMQEDEMTPDDSSDEFDETEEPYGEDEAEQDPVVREPDRTRVIIVPDGPVTGLRAEGGR